MSNNHNDSMSSLNPVFFKTQWDLQMRLISLKNDGLIDHREWTQRQLAIIDEWAASIHKGDLTVQKFLELTGAQ